MKKDAEELKRLALVDRVTGEILEERNPRRKNKHKTIRFGLRLFDNADIESQFLLLMNMNNVVIMENAEKLAEKCSMSKRNVFKYIDNLIKDNRVIKLKRGVYFVSPYWFTTGNLKALDELRRYYLDLRRFEDNKPKKVKQPKIYKVVVNE